MKIETMLKMLGVVFVSGLSWGGATVAAKQELKTKLDQTRFVAESVHVVNEFSRQLFEIKLQLNDIQAANRSEHADNEDIKSRLKDICIYLKGKAGCR